GEVARLDRPPDELEAEAPTPELGQHVDVGEVRERDAVGDRAREPDLAADVVGLPHEPLHCPERPSCGPVGLLGEVAVHLADVDSRPVVVELEAARQVPSHAGQPTRLLDRTPSAGSASLHGSSAPVFAKLAQSVTHMCAFLGYRRSRVAGGKLLPHPGTLLCLSSAGMGELGIRFQESVEAAGEEAFDAADRFAFVFAAVLEALVVVAGFLVAADAVERDHVQGAVELAIAAGV